VVEKQQLVMEAELLDMNDESCSIMEVSNCEIIDIDEYDSENTQLCAEYVKDIYGYLSTIEKQYRIESNFLENKIVNPKMRSVLIDWLIQVHLKFHLLQETLYLCVQIIDAYLMEVDVPKMQLQLVGVTAMFVASKYEEMYVPAIDDFVYMTDNTYTKAEIRTMEISILKQLDFMFCKPFPLHFLRRFSKAGQADPKQHTLAKYFMELSLHCAEFSPLDPSYLAACSLALSFKLLKGSEWNNTMEFYSTYKLEALYSGMHKIAKLVIKSSDIDYRYRAATNKYGTSKYLRISLLPELNGDAMKQLASESFKME
jgi:cyclin B